MKEELAQLDKFMYRWKMKKICNNTEPEEVEQPQPIMINMGDADQPMPTANIRVIENKVLFYGDIIPQSTLELNRILLDLDVKLQNTKNVLGDEYTPILHLHINTPGGTIMDAFAIVDTIRNMKSDVYTYIDGIVASAGTLIHLVGKKRFMGQNAHLLIHQLSSGVVGTYAEIEDNYYNTTNMMKLLKDFYKKYTKIPMKKLDEILKHDLYLTPEECLQFGIIDVIL